MPRFDVQIQQVEDDPMTQITEGTIVNGDTLSSIDHLDVIEIGLLHGLEMRYFCTHLCEVVLYGVFLAPTDLAPWGVSV